MIEKQVVLNLEMDLWQFFHLYQLEPGRICIIHIQCFPEREEVHILDGFTLPLEGTDFWIINRRFRGEISRPTSN
jgi:hypothetical protein